eukprot:3730631-Pyramimonas_sp.AAC.1
MPGISCRQDVQPLDSGEAEWRAGARGLSEGLGLKALFVFMGYSARELAMRQLECESAGEAP